MSHYDRESDIAALDLKGFDGGQVFGEDHGWGLLLRDRVTQEVVVSSSGVRATGYRPSCSTRFPNRPQGTAS